MDDRWYYAEASNRSFGPVTIEELGRILGAKKNSVDFLVWCPGMSNWGRAGDQFALKRYFESPSAPPLKFESGKDVPMNGPEFQVPRGEGQSAGLHPWRRYFARIFDLYLFVFIFFFFLGIAFPKLFEGSEKGADVLYGIVGSAAYAVFEGFGMNVFGRSLGKSLYGIRVFRDAGDGFPLSVSFKRSFLVWVKGSALGFLSQASSP